MLPLIGVTTRLASPSGGDRCRSVTAEPVTGSDGTYHAGGRPLGVWATEEGTVVSVARKWWQELVRVLAGRHLPGLRYGERFGAKEVLVLNVLAGYAGVAGDGCFASNRRIAADAGCSERTARSARSKARRAGLLRRLTHGAGRPRRGSGQVGAIDVLAAPGGEEGLRGLLERIKAATDARLVRREARRLGRPRVEQFESDAARIIRENPHLTKTIAGKLGKPPHEVGAVRVTAEILRRARGRRLRNPAAYVVTAVTRDRGRTLAAHWPDAGVMEGDSDRGRMSADVARLAAQLAPPD